MSPRSQPSAAAEAVQRRAVYQMKAEFFRILGHPVRVRILELLRDGERTVGDLQNELQMDSGGTSQHLGVLRKHGIIPIHFVLHLEMRELLTRSVQFPVDARQFTLRIVQRR